MKKKILSILIAICTVVLGACGGFNLPGQTVTLTLPAAFVGSKTQEELDAAVAKNNNAISAKLNEDGTVTYTLTKTQHDAMVKEIERSIKEQLKDLAGSDSYPNVQEIKANKDFSSFTVMTTSTTVSLSESFLALSLYVYGGAYASLSGKAVDNIHIDFVNVESGKVIRSADSSNIGKSQETTQTKPTTGNIETAPVKPAIELQETVLLDQNGIKITAKSLGESWTGKTMQILIENNSGQDLTFQTRNESVNGYMVDVSCSADVPNGKKAVKDITFLNSGLANCGIEDIAEVELSFHIFPMNEWGNTYMDTEPVSVQTSIAGSYEQPYNHDGLTVYDEDGIKIVALYLSDNASYLGPGLFVYIENFSGRDISIQTRNESVNGFMVSTSFSCDVMNGKRAVDSITIFSSSIEKNGIKKIENIELSFHIFPMNEWGGTIKDTDPISLTFE